MYCGPYNVFRRNKSSKRVVVQPNASKRKSTKHDGTFLGKNGPSASFLELENAGKAMHQTKNRGAWESNAIISNIMKRLVNLLGEQAFITLNNVLFDRFDGLQIHCSNARHCKQPFSALAYCSGYQPLAPSNLQEVANIMLPETCIELHSVW